MMPEKEEAEAEATSEVGDELIYESQPQLVVPTYRLPADDADDEEGVARFKEPRSVAEATARLKSALAEFDALAMQVGRVGRVRRVLRSALSGGVEVCWRCVLLLCSSISVATFLLLFVCCCLSDSVTCLSLFVCLCCV